MIVVSARSPNWLHDFPQSARTDIKGILAKYFFFKESIQFNDMTVCDTQIKRLRFGIPQPGKENNCGLAIAKI